MELGPNELRVLELNRRMVMAMAGPEQREFWLGVFAAADDHKRRQAAMERAARPVDIGAEAFEQRTRALMRQRSVVGERG